MPREASFAAILLTTKTITALLAAPTAILLGVVASRMPVSATVIRRRAAMTTRELAASIVMTPGVLSPPVVNRVFPVTAPPETMTIAS